MNLERLWQFKEIDMEADRFESKMRQSQKRQTLLKQRNFLMEQQANMKKIETDVAAMTDRLDAVKDEIERLQKVLTAALEEIEQNPAADQGAAEEQIGKLSKVEESIRHYETELTRMRKDADAKDKLQHEIRVRAAKTKAEYDKLKAEYDIEFKRDSAELKRLRARTEAAAEGIEEALMSRYKAIKQHCTPPMAEYTGGQCSGCFMSLPGATLLALKDSDTISTCDNCGRILYNPAQK